MPITISHQEWMRRTYSRTRRRSATLKALDEAIRIRHEPAAKKAMIEWIKEHNRFSKDWHRSVRNKDGVMETIYKQLGILGSEVPYANIGQEMDDKLAKAHVRREQRLAKQKLFAGKTLRFKSSFWGVTRRNSKSKVDTVKSAALTLKGQASNAMQVKSVVKDITTIIDAIMGDLPAAEANEIVTTVLGQNAAQFAVDAAPAIGVATSGAKAVKDWVGVAMKLRSKKDMESREEAIRIGDPSAAFQSILRIIDRHLQKQTADASIHSAAFAVKGVGLIADAGAATGTVTGALESLAALLNTLVDIAREAHQMKLGNEMLASGDLDITIFEKSPILGCYYIAIMDDSTIMDFDIENMGKDNWHLEARRLKIAIEPVVKKAGQLIAKSRVEIPGMENAKGVYQQSFKAKLKTWYKSKGFGVSHEEPDIIEAVVKGDV
jgi:hypothetical protein